MSSGEAKSREARKLGQRLRRLRKERGLSMERLAALAETDRTNIWKMEQGQVEPPLPRLRLLAKALGVEPSSLLDAEGVR